MADRVRRISAEPLLAPVQFRMLCDRVRDYSGLHFGTESQQRIERRVAERIESLGGSSVGSYLYELREGPEGRRELDALVDALTTSETFFFREVDSLRVLVEEVVPRCLRRAAGRPVRVWSAGCSSGEEPYTIAMLALEAGLCLGTDLELFASDVAPSALTRARRGVYAPSSLHLTPLAIRERYFEERDGRFRVCEALREHVEFIASNLMDPTRIDWLGQMDIIVCRNVLADFDGAARDRVLEGFYDRLRPGGHLLPGRADAWEASTTDFEPVRVSDTAAYRRPAVDSARSGSWHQPGDHTEPTGPRSFGRH